MLINRILFLCAIIPFLFSCENDLAVKKMFPTFIDRAKAKVSVVRKEDGKSPVVVPVDETKLPRIPAKKAVKTEIKFTEASVLPPSSVLAGVPHVAVPGKDSFLLPETIKFDLKIIRAGKSERIPAKDAAIKEKNPAAFSTFGFLQGLKQNYVRNILEDKRGNLWFATDEGVCCYDGKYFSSFAEKEGLIYKGVQSMLEDRDGNIWFGTLQGISKYDGYTFSNFWDKQDKLKTGIRAILQDKVGNIWFGADSALFKYDGKELTSYTTKQGLPNNSVSAILEDDKGQLWLGTDGGVSVFDGKAFSNFSTKEGLANSWVWSMMQDKKDNIWIGTYGGLSKYDGKTITNYTTKQGLPGNLVMSMKEDKKGNIWFGTYYGVAKYDKGKFTTLTNKDGLGGNMVLSMHEDRSENIWFGTDAGASKYDGRSFQNFTEHEGLPERRVWSLLEDKNGDLLYGVIGAMGRYDGTSFINSVDNEVFQDYAVMSMIKDSAGRLWIGTDGGVFRLEGDHYLAFTTENGLANNVVYAQFLDTKGNIWFCTDNGVSKYDGKSFTNFTTDQGLPSNTVRSVIEDEKGALWFGTSKGLSKYYGENFINYSPEGVTNAAVILAIEEDKDGDLWIGTENDGLFRFDGRDFVNFTTEHGLTNNEVRSLLQDQQGNIWIGNRFGINVLSDQNRKAAKNDETLEYLLGTKTLFKRYTSTDGFLGTGANGGKAILQTKNGVIWMGAENGLTAIHPENIVPDNKAPNIELSDIKLYDQSINWRSLQNKPDTTFLLNNGVWVAGLKFDSVSRWNGLPQHLSLAYDNNYLAFSFIGITMNQSRNVKYRYMLDGLDKNWSAITDKNEVAFGNLPHGNFTFNIDAMNSEGKWSDMLSYSFTIRPPWWKTWWLKVLVAILIISSVVFYIKLRERKLKTRQKELEHKIDIATEDIQYQKHIIEEKHKEITDSINYAERIQRSFLATKDLLDSNLNDYFVLFKPKDVVSGDFYWAGKLSNGKFALVTADSTGHGVPGAIMSLLNITSIEKAIEHYDQPSDILNSTRKTIIERLKKDGSAEGGKDGMDASLTVYDFKNKKLSMAAANNPVWIVRGTETIEIKADKMPVGKHDLQDRSFTQREIDLQTGDVVYTLTDGFPDQFGGPNGKKFMSKNLRELLAANAHLPMQAQKELLETTFKSWIGNLEQIDDVTVIGIRI